jgi:hypothetical protein
MCSNLQEYSVSPSAKPIVKNEAKIQKTHLTHENAERYHTWSEQDM